MLWYHYLILSVSCYFMSRMGVPDTKCCFLVSRYVSGKKRVRFISISTYNDVRLSTGKFFLRVIKLHRVTVSNSDYRSPTLVALRSQIKSGLNKAHGGGGRIKDKAFPHPSFLIFKEDAFVIANRSLDALILAQ